MKPAAVTLRTSDAPDFEERHLTGLGELTARAQGTGGRAIEAVELVRCVSADVPVPGGGRTLERWEVLASLAAGDLSVARIAEAHLDALAILAESGSDPVDNSSVWGVYAAEGPAMRLEASDGPDGWQLTGTKPWCSAADRIDRALVTAHTDGDRRLFAIDLSSPTVHSGQDRWVARGLVDVRSTSIVLDATPATAVGETGWYLSRPGFAWGGMGVAACWFGGLVAVARRVWQTGLSREPDQIAAMHLGRIDRHVTAGRLALAAAADLIDRGLADGPTGVVLAERVRGTIAAAVDSVLASAGHTLGPAPLAIDEDHARRVADLQLYVRQHHAERDAARLGHLLWAGEGAPW